MSHLDGSRMVRKVINPTYPRTGQIVHKTTPDLQSPYTTKTFLSPQSILPLYCQSDGIRSLRISLSFSLILCIRFGLIQGLDTTTDFLSTTSYFCRATPAQLLRNHSRKSYHPMKNATRSFYLAVFALLGTSHAAESRGATKSQAAAPPDVCAVRLSPISPLFLAVFS